MAAAKAILDEIHNPLPRVLSDYNAYTLGRLCGHNVAMTCLPSGVYGTVSAATVLVQMLSTFQKLQFGLMVGIGGGVPTASNADIRLGDVVVSKPTTTIGGVIQYDFGKTTPNGSFEYVGSLNKPPPVLLSAISQLQSAYMAGEQQIQHIIHEALAKNEFMKRKFSRPCEDRLFHAAYNHQNIPTRNAYDDIDECSACDLHQIVTRPLRPTDEPYIHYGLIASGNNVMKDALTRDQIAQPLGVLCFEMEAAGLMDQLPCLVIRGICDYCDSHKPKKWQGYASLTAAAYTKELLKFV
ncbi:nucleoside phosphorylase domain-containing protein, partial [Talaromyces proteolyticus]